MYAQTSPSGFCGETCLPAKNWPSPGDLDGLSVQAFSGHRKDVWVTPLFAGDEDTC